MVAKHNNNLSSSRLSLEAVATAANVSTATVSRVLNHSANVSDARKQAVLDACDALGYVINGRARALSLAKTWTMGAVVPTLSIETFSRLLNAFQHQLQDAGYSLLLANTEFDEEIELKEVSGLISHGIDGLMLVGSAHSPKLWKLIENNQIPYIQVLTSSQDHPSIGIDNRQIAYDITDYFIQQGHEHLCIIVGMPPNNDRVQERMKGIRQRLAESQLSLQPEDIYTDIFTLEESVQITRQLLLRDHRPTAYIYGNDLLAFGALLAAQQLQVRVPDDISVIGFNNYEMSPYLSPSLSTVDVDLDALGQAAAHYLIKKNQGIAAPPLPHIHTALILRNSTGKACPRQPE